MNNLTIQPRQTALTQEDYNKLELLVSKHFELKEKYIFGSVKTVDEYGIHKTERDVIGTELELIPNGEVNPQLLESLQRPFNNPSIGIHLTRLAIHKGFKGGDFGLQVVIEDSIKDLSGKSEWAIIRACESLRKDSEPFFKYDRFIELVNQYHNALIPDEPEPTKKLKPVDEFKPDTAEQKAKVAELIKNSLKKMGE